MDAYADAILELYKHPIKKERLPNPTTTYTKVNTSCGDTITADLVIEDTTITAIGWDGVGCAISQANMSLLADELIGKTVQDILAITEQEIIEQLEITISPRRSKCALLGFQAVLGALHITEKTV